MQTNGNTCINSSLLFVVAQDREIGSSDMFQDFMLSCQQVLLLPPFLKV